MSAPQGWRPPRPPELPLDAHKGIAGRVAILAGSRWMPGAAILAARAAMRGGAGLVAVACGEGLDPVALASAVPEATWMPPTRGALNEFAPHAVLAGPGIGRGEAARALLELALEQDCPLVLDADALNLLAGALEKLRGRRGAVVLTPHPGEAARLLGREVGSGAAERLDRAREIASKSGAICCLKGKGTVVTDGERTWVNDTGTSAMATAGAGDVLAGLLAAYLARCVTLSGSWTPFDAAARAVRVHGRAGELAEEALGALAVTASDLVEHLSPAQRELA